MENWNQDEKRTEEAEDAKAMKVCGVNLVEEAKIHNINIQCV